ncbi:MAG TPA: NAD(P)/FAD-dependent oxidoreductase [Polyangiaceae bacterium]|jgi:phytoene dehydrogenase-like protein|nr:NAD(P)/FAD-dependent oxidoreductase [Polyangiaceae bacterium]
MEKRHVVIVGGGLAGLSAGCYARASGYRTTIVEHNLALGGVCTAWSRGPYTIDGCIHWLTGGAFQALYEELGIVPRVALRTIEKFVTYRDAETGREVTVSRDLDATAGALFELAPEDTEEIRRMVEGADRVARLDPGVDRPVELSTMRDQLGRLWNMRHELGTIAHFRKPLGVWSREHLQNERLRRLFSRMLPAEAPALFLLMMLGYLKHGYLSRPEGGTARFRDALIDTYRARGGEAVLHNTVDEILVEGNLVQGVRLADGSIIDADVVISTASAPETVLRLLGGRYGEETTRHRLEHWKLFQPVVLVSYGVALPFASVPSTLIIDGIEPIDVGGVSNEHLYLRVYNDDDSFAPPGHTVVQAMLATDYEYWAKTGSAYNAEKDAISSRVLERLEAHLPGIRAATRLTDVATPLTFWHMARSWRGAYEGWLPNSDSMFGHVEKALPGLSGLYLAGQWVEPGGGVPTALMSGRQATQLLCADEGVAFNAGGPRSEIAATRL